MNLVEIKLCFRLFIFCILVSPHVSNASSGGTLCMSKMPGSKPGNFLPPMTQPELYIRPSASLEVEIDGKIMAISPQKGGQITGLSINKKHLLIVRIENKIKQSFWFEFKEKNSPELCLWYYEGYGTLSLLEKNDNRCQCL